MEVVLAQKLLNFFNWKQYRKYQLHLAYSTGTFLKKLLRRLFKVTVYLWGLNDTGVLPCQYKI